MALKRPTANPNSGKRRFRWLAAFAVGLLIAYTVMMLAVPDFAMLSKGGWGSLFGRRADSFQPKRQPKRQRVYEQEGRIYLWAGDDPTTHFDITESRINRAGLAWGLGREYFDPLIEPEFVRASELEAQRPLHDSMRVLVVKIGDEMKVYPLGILRHHELVNDVVDGRPIIAAYCVLSDLGAVYDRRIANHTFTFALSGYTYSDPAIWDGRHTFVMWDRDTESLWWPLLGKAVSGPMIDTPLPVVEQDLWAQTTWGEIKTQHPDPLILKPGQQLEPPADWPKLTAPSPGPPRRGSIAPQWGENPRLGGD